MRNNLFPVLAHNRTYIIKRNGKEVTAIYGTYEEARRLVRARIRRAVKSKRTIKKCMWDDISRNPTSISVYGYKIVRA